MECVDGQDGVRAATDPDQRHIIKFARHLSSSNDSKTCSSQSLLWDARRDCSTEHCGVHRSVPSHSSFSGIFLLPNISIAICSNNPLQVGPSSSSVHVCFSAFSYNPCNVAFGCSNLGSQI